MDGDFYQTDEALARALQEEEETSQWQGQSSGTIPPHKDYSAERQRQHDMMAAVRRQRDEEWRFRNLQREDTKFAKELQGRELAEQLQAEASDEIIAMELQESEGELDRSVHSTEDIAHPGGAVDTSESLDDVDAKLAAEVHDREVAYQLQLELDKQMAQSLARNDEERNNLPPRAVKAQEGQGLFDGSPPRERHEETVLPAELNPQPSVGPPRLPNRQRRDNRPPRERQPRDNPQPQPRPRQRHRPQRASRETATPAQPDPDDYEANWELAERLGEVKNRSLDKEQRNQLPHTTFKGKSSEDSEEEDFTCKVCLSEFERGERLTILPCLHKYHSKCIDKWFDNQSTCPICTLDVKEELKKV